MADLDRSYVSDHTKWMNDLLEKNPEWVADQKVGRALWWDKRQEVETTARNAESNVAHKAYPYDVNFFGD